MNTSVKKLVLHPVYSDSKEWNRKVRKHFEDKVENYTDWLSNAKTKAEKSKAEKALSAAVESLESINNGEITNKMINDYTYALVRSSCAAEAAMKNITIHRAYTTMLERDNEWARIPTKIKESWSDYNKERKSFNNETTKIVNKMFAYCNRVCKSNPEKMDSAFDGIDIDNVLGGYGFAWMQELKSAFWKSVKDGMLRGDVAPPHFRKNSPFTIAKATMGFSSDYDTAEETLANWDNNTNLYFDFGSNQYSSICVTNATIAKFKIDTGNSKNRAELLTTLKRLYTGEYVFCGSSIQMDRNDKKIILNLVIQSPKKIVELCENNVVGVDIGIAVPAYCAFNNNDWAKKIGNGKDFNAKREQIKSERERLQRSMAFSNGGHGRKKKLKHLDNFVANERNFTNTYNHKVSKQVVDFALKCKAQYINIEYLRGISEDDTFLKRWAFYDLQTKIKYKAERYGIIVREVNPCYTSQICSVCGKYHEENRENQSDFICKHCGAKMNADKNAAKNIANIPDKLILKTQSNKSKSEMISEAKLIYGIS